MDFWNIVKQNLTTLLDIQIPVSQSLILLNDLSQLHLQTMQKRIFFAGFTAARKMVAL